MQNAQPHSCDDQLASHVVILRLFHFLANVTELAVSRKEVFWPSQDRKTV